MIQSTFFPYSWHMDDEEEDVTSIRVYGLDDKNKNVCLRIDDFTPFVYLELPDHIPWTSGKAQLLGNKLDTLLGIRKPLVKSLLYKQRLYYAHINKNGKRKTFPYLFLSFSHHSDIRNMSYKIRQPINIIGIGMIKLKMHEQDASPILQFTSYKNISTAGWIDFKGKKIEKDNQKTLCDNEYKVKWKQVKPNNRSTVACPLIMSFDIEVNSTNPSAMPNAEKPGDKIFQISCILQRYGSDEKSIKKYILTLGEPDPEKVGDDVEILMYETEHDLLLGYTDFMQEYNPNIIIGYNILNFDIPYMIERAKMNYCIFDYDQQGFNKYGHAKEKSIKWSSSAYGNQTFQFLDAEGRLYVDLLPLIKRDYKLSNYKLKTVSTKFLGETKDPLSVKGIFKCYRIGIQNNNGVYSKVAKKAMGICAKYCIVDSILVLRLFNKLQTWVGLCEMAKTCNVPIFYLYTQGQQIKVYSQLYLYCLYNNYVVEKDGYITKDNERYIGATVFQPIAGVYDGVVPFDFASLYPTIIIAYNICYSTLVTDKSIPDSKCHVMEWEDHQGCIHDKTARKTKPKHVMCEKRYFRFLKEPKGVMPTVLQNLLNARAHTRKQIKVLKKILDGEKLTDDDHKLIDDLIPEIVKKLKSGEKLSKLDIGDLEKLIEVLDKRQLAYKVSANSMYGAMGVTRGYLPFMPGAMCTAAMGRKNIGIVADVIPKRFKGKLIYGDTDCLTGEMPALIQWTDPLDPSRIELSYKTMETLSDGNWTRINPNKEISKAIKGYQIWSDEGFTDIINVVRCGILKPLSRILTHVGEVTCSNEHSLLRDTLESVTPLDVKIKDTLCTTELPLPYDTPVRPVYKNKLTAKVIEDYVIPDVYIYDNWLSAELVFVWGVFFADGSCGTYDRNNKNSTVSSWTISKGDNKLLERCMDILNKHEKSMEFKILDTMQSTRANRLVAKQHSQQQEHKGTIKAFVKKYRDLFYDNRKYKKIPDKVLNLPLEFRQAFFMGYYAGDGSKKDPSLTITNKGAIGTAGIFYLMRSIGYQVSVNIREDKSDVYKLTGSTPDRKFRCVPNAVKKIIPMEGEEGGYIYDIQTANHHFAAGVGQLVVHNSNYIVFPHLKTAAEIWDHAIYVADEVTKLFPKPICLEFEKEIYWRFLILTKKRYMYKRCFRDGIVEEKIGKKGVLLARRDNSKFIRDSYEEMIMMIFNKATQDEIMMFVTNTINNLCSHFYPYTDFVVTKSIKSHGDGTVIPFIDEKGKKKGMMGDYKVSLLSMEGKERKRQFGLKDCNNANDFYMRCLPPVVQLAERMRGRGQRVDAGSRLEYVISTLGGHKALQYVKVEDAIYFGNHSSVLKLDYMYYLKLMSNPFDDVLNILYYDKNDTKFKFQKNFVLNQYKYRLKYRIKMLEELQDVLIPHNLVFSKN